MYPSYGAMIFIELCSIGRPKHVRVMAGALEGDIFVGPKAEEHRGLLSISYPMEHGIVTDWNDMERIWSYIYSKVSERSNSKVINRLNMFKTLCIRNNWPLSRKTTQFFSLKRP